MRKKGLILAVSLLLLLAFFCEIGWSEVGGPHWKRGQVWHVEAMYRKLDGSWSRPVEWKFKVAEVQGSRYLIEVTNRGRLMARLKFCGSPFYLQEVETFIYVRGQVITTTERFSEPTVVVPRHSVVPYHFPVFERAGLPGGIRKVRVYRGWMGVESVVDLHEGQGVEVTVKKGEKILFLQRWQKEFPWATWTEAEGIRAWLKH